MRRAILTAALLLLAPPAGAAGAEIVDAAYARPTERYAHGVLGDRIEWGSLRATLADGQAVEYVIPDASVFEDIAPRLADIDGDGRPEVWTVRADAADGARLEAYVVENEALVRRFAGPAIGVGFRWLNPVGVADFDGDGVSEAAYVETPHIGGILTVLKPVDDRLQIVARLQTYSTHKIGSTRLDLAAIADLDRDGAAEIVLPTQLHDRLAVVSMHGGQLVERWRSAPLPTIGGGLNLVDHGAFWRARYVAADGAQAETRVPLADFEPTRLPNE